MKNKIYEIREKICALLKKRIMASSGSCEPMIFGPVPSRRLGISLGINNMQSKKCTYDCAYCQSGSTSICSTCGCVSVSPYALYFAVQDKLKELEREKIKIDYLSFIPGGEPTLDLNLARELLLLKEFGIKTAVFTNGALLWNKRIRENLLCADYVSVKIDTADEATWQKLNRPHMRLRYNLVLDGIRNFASEFEGELATETMLVKDINDNAGEIIKIGEYLKEVNCQKSFFTTPTRPPSKKYAVSPAAETLSQLAGVINRSVRRAEILFEGSGASYMLAGDIEKELLNILAVHPVNRNELIKIFAESGGHIKAIAKMVETGLIKEKTYNGQSFLYAVNPA
jgi:wyosine [tRNA(Phe)-imidazoG37] synthetase (radical SAM superfamily)